MNPYSYPRCPDYRRLPVVTSQQLQAAAEQLERRKQAKVREIAIKHGLATGPSILAAIAEALATVV